jgi:hypothetical protein
MKENAPATVRFILAIDRSLAALGRIAVMARDEALWAWTSEATRERANRALYDGLRTFYPGGETFDGGLFDWERAALAPPFPTSGRILVGAAGAGREMAELAKLGYEVVAFEPAAALADAAKKMAATYPACEVVSACYAGLVEAVESASGPLAAQVCGRKFDGVILGWISFSYVWRQDREALLNAVRTLAPHAPVLLSYLRNEERSDGWLLTFRDSFRRFLRLAGARNLAEPGDSFLPWAGFYQSLTPEEVRVLADRTGYRPVRMNSPDAAYALLEPN